MGIIYQKDKRTGITYVYESKAVLDKEKQQSRAKRRLIGKLDPETGAIVLTDADANGARTTIRIQTQKANCRIRSGNSKKKYRGFVMKINC